jgi:Raf kinase inhibitor-like YbhB/YbcL family protein
VSFPRRLVLAATLTTALALLTGCGFLGTGDDPDIPPTPTAQTVAVGSSAFEDGAAIPRQYTCKGANESPPLTWSGVPSDARGLALVVDDPDAPGRTFVHWVLYDIDPGASGLAAGAVPDGARQAKNSAGQPSYTGPCPPSGTHHYRFTVYVLRSPLTVPSGGDTASTLAAIRAKAVAQGTLTGTYAAG